MSLLCPGGFRPRDFALGVAVIALVGAVSGLAMALLAPPVRQLPLAAWAAWLPVVLPALFVQTAASVTTDGKSITLKGVNPQTLMFTDRPERMTGDASTAKFVAEPAIIREKQCRLSNSALSAPPINLSKASG